MISHNHFRNNQSELIIAESMLKKSEKELQEIRRLLEERRSELHDLDSDPHRMDQSGDINRLLGMKLRSVELHKSINDLAASEAESIERVESARRNLYGLYIRLERLRQEAATLNAKLSLDDLSEDKRQQERRNLMRIRVQIEAIAGAD